MQRRCVFSYVYVFVFSFVCLKPYSFRTFTDNDVKMYREKAEQMFHHAYDHYLKSAFPYDELQPISCKGMDTWGSFSLTLIDALDTLAVMKNYTEFRRVVNTLLSTADFNVNINVSVFETNIRGLNILTETLENGNRIKSAKKIILPMTLSTMPQLFLINSNVWQQPQPQKEIEIVDSCTLNNTIIPHIKEEEPDPDSPGLQRHEKPPERRILPKLFPAPVKLQFRKHSVADKDRLKNVAHIPQKGDTRRCAYCSTAAEPYGTQWMCPKCDVGLCMIAKGNENITCFQKFHANWK